MKKSFLYMVGLIALMVVSCTDEAIVEQSGNGLRITGSVAPDSRTTFVEGEGVIETHWNVNDHIGLYTDEQSNLDYRAKNEGKSTEFESYNGKLTKEEGKNVYAYYPYDYYAEGDKIHLRGKSSYQGIYHDIDNTRPFLYSKAQIVGNTLNFQFKHLFAYLQLKISVQDIKDQLAATQELYPNDEVTTDNGWIEINSDNNLSTTASGTYFDIKTEELSGAFNNYICIYLDNIDFNSDKAYTFLIPILPQPGGANISGEINFHLKSGSRIPKPLNVFKKKVSEEGLKAGNVYVWNLTDLTSTNENRKILESFYQKTRGEKWTQNDNWLSDKPLGTWYGINKFSSGNTNDIYRIELSDNNLSGEFPEELAALMDMVDIEGYYNSTGNFISNFEISFNRLYGSIPDIVKENKRWNKWGWNIINQFPVAEGEIDLTESNLYLENIQVEDLFADESTINNLYDIFKKNKLTQIVNGAYSSEMSIEDIQEQFHDSRVNQHLDYHNKGLCTLIFNGTGTEKEVSNFKNNVSNLYGSVTGIQWLKGKSPIPNHTKASGYFFDSEGQLVYMAFYDIYCESEEWMNVLINERSNEFLKKVLGEPTEHPQFTSELYTSTDYSHDGKVVTLQEATVGQGINLTFLGEGFVDKDMESEGIYEQTMHEAMEQFFSYEPYRSFRNRFNVYAVKVVSPNAIDVEGAKFGINHDNDVCFKYAQKIPNAEKNPPMVAVVYKRFIEDYVEPGRSHCYMYDDGSFVTYLYQGLQDASVLMHEAGGHGFGGLLDEYVEPGYESLTLPENKKTELDNYWTLYKRGANVDWRNDASTVKWSHFLNDERYENEGLGIYEGAYLYGYGAYRPTENSMMRYNYADGVQFNAPSREEIYKRIMQRSEGDSWTYDYEEFVKYDAINRKAASRSASRTLTEAERQEYIKNHRPPTFIKGTWRDAVKNGKDKIVVPLR